MFLNRYLIDLYRFLIDFQQIINFRFPIFFWDPDFPNSFRKNRSPMAPQGKPLCGKESHMDPLHVRFSSQTVESIYFYQSNSTFSWKPCFLRSSVWGQFRQVFVFPPRLRGVVGFSIQTTLNFFLSFFLSLLLSFFLSWGNPLAAAGETGVGMEHCPSFKDIE